MKQFVFFIFGICLAVIVSSCSTTSTASKTAKQVAESAALKLAVDQRRFIVDVDHMTPMKGAPRSLTSPYSLEVRGDSVISYLPYFGEAYSVPYGGGRALNFTSTISDYQSSVDGKGRMNVYFKTKTDEDRYEYRIQIYSNGSSSIDVTSVNRQPISFDGTAQSK